MAAGRKQQVSSGAGVGVGVALVALLVMAAPARAGAARVCNVEQSALETCRSYCTTGSQESYPSQDCCNGLRGADVKCFCGYKGLLRAYGLDPNRAMQIPSKCGFGAPNPCGY